jgi:hypothetical protein
MVHLSLRLHKVFPVLIASVWLINGLVCKILQLVPRHQRIVARILGQTYAPQLTQLIGVGEVLLALWILSGKWSRLCAWTQIGLVALMNGIECMLAPDLLLFGRLNALFALLFIGLVYGNQFILSAQPLPSR